MAENNTHYIYGLHAVQAFLEREPEMVSKVWLENSRRDEKAKKILQLAHDANVKPERVKRDVLDKLAGENANHQGVVALSKDTPAGNEKTLKALIEDLNVPAFLLILDGVTPPYSSGTTMPFQPISPMAAQTALSKPCSLPLSRISRNFGTGDCSETQAAAWSLSMDCSAVSAATSLLLSASS